MQPGTTDNGATLSVVRNGASSVWKLGGPRSGAIELDSTWTQLNSFTWMIQISFVNKICQHALLWV
jgi:hypothetical protein